MLQLPLAAVLELAALDELQVISENTVATALASWVAANLEGRRQYGPQLMLQLIRVQHLTATYQRLVLQQLPGIGDDKGALLSMLGDLLYARHPTTAAFYRHTSQLHLGRKLPRASADASCMLRYTFNLASVLSLVTTRLGPQQQCMFLLDDANTAIDYNGFTVDLLWQVVDRPPVVPGSSTTSSRLVLHLLVGVQLRADSSSSELAMQIPLRSDIMVQGKAEVAVTHYTHVLGQTLHMPDVGTATGNPFSTRTRASFACGPYRVVTGVRSFELGPGAVHDAATLMSALVAAERNTSTINQAAIHTDADTQHGYSVKVDVSME